MGRQRGAGLGGGHDEREQTLNQMLVEMDSFEGNEVLSLSPQLTVRTCRPALLRPAVSTVRLWSVCQMFVVVNRF
ncbi:MAG: hypothetical protein ACLR9W_08535 [Enterobacter hormaechei]